MPEPLIYIGYAVTVALVVFLSIKLGKYVDVIDEKSNISGAFIGAVMLAAVTSLPELFTSLSSIWLVHENSMIIGNILGSDLINLAFFGIILVIFGRGLKSVKFNKFYYISIAVTVALYALTTVGLYLGEYITIGWYNLISPVILVMYGIFIKKMPKLEEPSGESKEEKLTLKQAVVRFAVCAVVLIGASIAMTYFTDLVADKLNLGATFAGALFLGVATSLPEFISSCTLCARGNYNAAAGNIMGSCVFNFLILFVADTFSFMPDNSNVYIVNNDSMWLLILGACACAATALMLLVQNKAKSSAGKQIGVSLLNLICPGLYVVYLLISLGII